ncbi:MULTISPECIES: hypothetical protein [Streptomyces]|nr:MULTISPECIES: hypothetical protein [Streptomyces]
MIKVSGYRYFPFGCSPRAKYYFQIGSIKGAKVVDVYQVRIRPKK